MKQNNPVTNRPTGNVIRCRRSIIPFLFVIIATCMPSIAWGQTPGTQFTDANSGLKFEVLSAPANSVKVIGNSYSNISYTIPVTVSDQGNTYDVVEIGEDAFFKCSDLESVTFAQGSKVETIGKNAFFQCSNLTSVTFQGDAPTFGNQVFDNTSSGLVIYVPDGKVADYETALSGKLPAGAKIMVAKAPTPHTSCLLQLVQGYRAAGGGHYLYTEQQGA